MGIAASAPIFCNFGNGNTFLENGGNDYWKVITNSFSLNGIECPDNVRKSYAEIEILAKFAVGRKKLSEVFKTCKPVETEG